MKRREARELAFIILFEKTFKDETIDEIIESATEGRSIQVDDYVYNTCVNVELNIETIDEIIAKHSTKWKLNRMSKVSLAAMRLAVYEIEFCPDMPIKVSINESVELAKTYAGQDSSSFVNGVLGAYVRQKEADEKKTTVEVEKTEEKVDTEIQGE